MDQLLPFQVIILLPLFPNSKHLLKHWELAPSGTFTSGTHNIKALTNWNIMHTQLHDWFWLRWQAFTSAWEFLQSEMHVTLPRGIISHFLGSVRGQDLLRSLMHSVGLRSLSRVTFHRDEADAHECMQHKGKNMKSLSETQFYSALQIYLFLCSSEWYWFYFQKTSESRDFTWLPFLTFAHALSEHWMAHSFGSLHLSKAYGSRQCACWEWITCN